jgi:ABC1 atypical kinase-like domain
MGPRANGSSAPCTSVAWPAAAVCRVLRELGVWGHRPATREGAQEFRQALEELGTTYIKLGQRLSSRLDLLPDVYIEELGRLVDDVLPVPFHEIKRVIAEELPPDVFVRVEPKPLATASIAQIHAALLGSGREVIVKVRRRGARRPAADLVRIRHRSPDDVRPRREDAGAGGLDRPRPVRARALYGLEDHQDAGRTLTSEGGAATRPFRWGRRRGCPTRSSCRRSS